MKKWYFQYRKCVRVMHLYIYMFVSISQKVDTSEITKLKSQASMWQKSAKGFEKMCQELQSKLEEQAALAPAAAQGTSQATVSVSTQAADQVCIIICLILYSNLYL